ncbi:MAG: T9SS type A sorting domain-containing protein, partial [Bacteroidota bacterium]
MKKLIIGILFWLISFAVSYSQGVSKGVRIDLTSKLDLASGQFAQLFIPDYFSAGDSGKYLLVFHLHSASWAAEDEVYKSRTNAILFNIYLGGFSSSYQNYFVDQNKFYIILDLVRTELNENNIIENPIVKNLIITSFSAGYGGVREILKNETYYLKIDAITLADGLHSNLEESLMREQMKDFLRFAKDASNSKKIMLLTHSNILTYTYANTTETSDYLINNIGTTRNSVNISDAIGMQYSIADTGKFHVKGYRGDTAEDHMKHLYNMDLMLKDAVDNMSTITHVKKKALTNNGSVFSIYPNPFNSSTKINFYLSQSGNVKFSVFNILGELVYSESKLFENSGMNNFYFNANSLSGGVYFINV